MNPTRASSLSAHRVAFGTLLMKLSSTNLR
jgi:hypothetical protein